MVLIADESADFVNSLSDALTVEGLECLKASDGKEAYFQCLEKLPDIVVLGFNIVKEADGIQTAKEILSRRSQTKIIILTNANSRITTEHEGIGIELFISKNENLQRIVRTVCAVRDLKISSRGLIAK